MIPRTLTQQSEILQPKPLYTEQPAIVSNRGLPLGGFPLSGVSGGKSYDAVSIDAVDFVLGQGPKTEALS